jgi:isoleucyl-tRNA synthetase
MTDDDNYKTMDPKFMESVWWVFKQLWDKGLVYRGKQVMPYSTKCNTPLSNFEAGQNYKDVEDTTIYVAFEIIGALNLEGDEKRPSGKPFKP